MKFRTEYVAEKAPFCIDPSLPAVLLGSCFADNITKRMCSCLWEAENPLGTLYNPLSIAAAMNVALDMADSDKERGSQQFEESLFESNGLWRSWLFDSKLAAETSEDVREAFIARSVRLHSLLNKAQTVFITFGTSWCYYLLSADKKSSHSECEIMQAEERGEEYLVANCHKQPSALFVRRRPDIEEVTECWDKMLLKLRERYPQLKVVFTVSPVRHLKDGFAGNVRSKAILLLAVEQLCEKHDNCYYFPAYEIVNDDLRDYRFYASDLVHPSEEAIEYIWEIFKETFINEKGLQRLKEGEAIRKGLDHRPLPNATRQPSPASIEKEQARIAALEERKRRLLKQDDL